MTEAGLANERTDGQADEHTEQQLGSVNPMCALAEAGAANVCVCATPARAPQSSSKLAAACISRLIICPCLRAFSTVSEQCTAALPLSLSNIHTHTHNAACKLLKYTYAHTQACTQPALAIGVAYWLQFKKLHVCYTLHCGGTRRCHQCQKIHLSFPSPPPLFLSSTELLSSILPI